MNTRKIVCACYGVTDYDVESVFSQYTSINDEALRTALKIGTRCGSCQKDRCDLIDIKYSELMKELKIKYKD